MLKQILKRKTTRRRMLYLLGILSAVGLWSLYNYGKHRWYEALDISDQVQVLLHIKDDTYAAQKAFDTIYRMDTEYVSKHNKINKREYFLNVCRETSCQLHASPIFRICKRLSKLSWFKEHRVYSCSLKITLENDQLLKCKPIKYRAFTASCDHAIAQL